MRRGRSSSLEFVSGYPDYMLESVDQVERTRDRRLDERFELMSLDERDEILRKYHPDYKESGKRALRLGPNKGIWFHTR